MRDRIRFHQWLQFQIDRQLARASAALPVMQDLPIGFDADGADAWAFQDVLAHGISVGAPPDEFNTRGQDWGLPPFVPDQLRAAGYEPFVQTIRALPAPRRRPAHRPRDGPVPAVLDSGAAWSPRSGAYVRSRADDLLAIVALESQRARAVIVGEDLGTVEERTRAGARRAAHPVVPAAVVREDAAGAAIPEQALQRDHDPRPADDRRAVDRRRPRGPAAS